MSTFENLWQKFAASKKYREEFVAAQVKRGIPFQIRALMKNLGLSQQDLASRAGRTQGVVSRAANPNYGNLTRNTIIRIAAGFDVAFIGKFVPFSELDRWFTNLSEETVRVPVFEEENAAFRTPIPVGFEANLSTGSAVAAAADVTPASSFSQKSIKTRMGADWQSPREAGEASGKCTALGQVYLFEPAPPHPSGLSAQVSQGLA